MNRSESESKLTPVRKMKQSDRKSLSREAIDLMTHSTHLFETIDASSDDEMGDNLNLKHRPRPLDWDKSIPIVLPNDKRALANELASIVEVEEAQDYHPVITPAKMNGYVFSFLSILHIHYAAILRKIFSLTIIVILSGKIANGFFPLCWKFL